MSNKYPINENHIKYYKWLEDLRIMGITNMYGAAPYLKEVFEISSEESKLILLEWMSNYNELSKRFGWQK